MPLPGYRANPVTVLVPGDLERATRHVARPSPGQASAGNYRKAHVNVGGLDVTIETPKEGMRRGIGPDGTPWAVQIQADYGYVKQTTGADGDQVDVYLGPNSHQADVLPVWIIDQCDADTREWDEHKCMLGFPHGKAARDVYLGGFSDGRGHLRIGSVVRMSFDAFRNWLKSGQTKKPIAYRISPKSASDDVFSVPYGATVSSRVSGVPMTTEQDKSAAPDPRTAGYFTKLLSKALGRMTPDERTEMLQDAAAMTSAELTKADNMMTVDSAHTGFIEDHWSDGPVDDIRVANTHGPGSSAASGTIPVGPSQQASGNGAERMESQYSRYSPQTGLQSSTEKLGRDISGIRGAMKSIMKAVESLSTQIEVLKAGAAPLAGVSAPEADVLQKMIDASVAKALDPVKIEIRTLVSKAFEKKDKEDEKEDDEEAKSAAQVAKASEKDKTEDADEEGVGKSETALAAAELRVMAKARVAHAKLRLSKALDYAAEDKAKAAQRAMAFAEINLAKAQTYLDEATSLQNGKAGISTQSIALDIAKAKKGIAASVNSNQNIWPNTTDKQSDFGKAEEPGAVETTKAAAPPASADLAKAVAQIEAAATGMGMMTASVADLFKALSSQTQATATAPDGERQNMPPVFALAKASPSDLATREAELARLRDSNVISFEDHDHARDALTRVRMGLPEETIKAMVDRLPEAARAVLVRSAA